MDEKKVLKLLSSDPNKAISILIEQHGRGVHTICASILRGFPAEDIEEAEADAYLKLWRNRSSVVVDDTHSVKSYLYTIARNTAIDRYRQRKPADEPFDDKLEALLMDETCVEDEVVGHVINELLLQVIEGLGEPDCDVFYGKYFLFLRNREIAERLGLTEKKVENILYRGKEKLRKALLERGIDGYVR